MMLAKVDVIVSSVNDIAKIAFVAKDMLMILLIISLLLMILISSN